MAIINGTNGGNDILIGFDGDDVLEGGAGADELFGSAASTPSAQGLAFGRGHRVAVRLRVTAGTPRATMSTASRA